MLDASTSRSSNVLDASRSLNACWMLLLLDHPMYAGCLELTLQPSGSGSNPAPSLPPLGLTAHLLGLTLTGPGS